MKITQTHRQPVPEKVTPARLTPNPRGRRSSARSTVPAVIRIRSFCPDSAEARANRRKAHRPVRSLPMACRAAAPPDGSELAHPTGKRGLAAIEMPGIGLSSDANMPILSQKHQVHMDQVHQPFQNGSKISGNRSCKIRDGYTLYI